MFYFNWLQENNPTGEIEKFPELKNNFETSVNGIYCAGDITGIPLIKLATDSGHECIDYLYNKKKVRPLNDLEIYDLIIIGAGPAGISAALNASEKGYNYIIIESSKMFNTIENFPAQKPIVVTPENTPFKSKLKFYNGTKESLLDELKNSISNKNINIKEEENVKTIKQEKNNFIIETSKNNYNTKNVLITIGKSGNARKLKIKGENNSNVFTKLIDPTENKNKNILIVGGGDSAVETAIALAKNNNISFSYRKKELTRPKEHNIIKFNELIKQKKITPYLNSELTEISKNKVIIKHDNIEKELKIDNTYILIGTEIPIKFFKRSNIKIEGERNILWYIKFICMLSFFSMLYFGKSGFAINIFSDHNLIEKIIIYLKIPFINLNSKFSYSLFNFYAGWIGSIIFIISAFLVILNMVFKFKEYFSTSWNKIKYSYFIIVCFFYSYIYFSNIFYKNANWVEQPTFWYSFLYCTTIIIFGLRRIYIHKTKYIIYQTLTLIFIQVFFLFLVPFYLYDNIILKLFPKDSLIITQLFPEGKWSSFAFILFWPLNINTFGASVFWTIFPFIQTFGILFFIVKKWGKGVYCGWICSCGGMAETLGDEYRTKSFHSKNAKKLENIGQFVLWFSILATTFHYFSKNYIFSIYLWYSYKLLIDIVFAGVLGLGVYFFISGRIWCRYGCPLAALMNIYTKFSIYRIISDKKKCISCNICTKTCHMGIDVMNFANKGIPMNDVQCVRCSSCIVNCPMNVLSFGEIPEMDIDNNKFINKKELAFNNWKSGLNKVK